MSRVIYLDIDGVLNTHQAQTNGYCRCEPENVHFLNAILKACPEARLVISSAWRYLVLSGSMTVEGFENLLMSHGVCCHHRVLGVTEQDRPLTDQENGLAERERQIKRDMQLRRPEKYVVLDDLPLSIGNLVKTNGAVGLTGTQAALALELLR